MQEILTQFTGPAGYLFFFLLVTACGFGFPFNEDITLVAAAVLSASGVFDLWLMMLLAFAAVIIGDAICFIAAYKWGLKVLRMRPFCWAIKEQQVQNARRIIEQHSRLYLFVVRFLPIVRNALFFAAGTLRVPISEFFLMNTIAALIYVPLVMLPSYYLSSNIDVVIQAMKQFQFVALGLFVAAAIYFVIRKNRRRRSA